MKNYLIMAVRILTKVFRIFPVRKNIILCFSYSGTQYSDSPRYISDYLLKKYPRKFNIVWAFKNPQEFEKMSENIKIVKYGGLRFMYLQATASCVITNTGVFKGVACRSEQLVINTWHGGGAYKKVGMNNPFRKKWQIVYAKRFGQADVNLFLSSSAAFSQKCIHEDYNYKGKILGCGLPRNDIFINGKWEEIRLRTREELKIPQNTNVLLYAPTWKNYDTDKYEKINFPKLSEALKNKSGKEYIMLMRTHHMSGKANIKNISIRDVSDYPDMQRLLCCADILITDYSSCIWDYSLMFKPGFLFVPDIDKYLAEFDLHTPIEKWGFPVCRSNEELLAEIASYDAPKAKKRIKENHDLFKSFESGKACQAVADEIIRHSSLK